MAYDFLIHQLMNYHFPNVGTSKEQHGYRFTVWAPGRKKVELMLSNKAAIPLQKDEGGCWSALVPDVHAGETYRYRLDDDQSLPDPASRRQPEGVHGPSAVTGSNYEWADDAWKGISLGDMIIYELHVGTFTASGNFEGVITRLDYLKELGINAIELMPLAQFPGERNWGYDLVYPFAVQESYGGIEGLKKLVNAAHQKGIAIILDVIYNHLGPEGNYLPQFAPYFTEKYKTPWGRALNFDDAYCDGVRNYYWQNALMWLDEFRIDGLRLDAVHAIWDFSANHFLLELTKKVTALEDKTGRKKTLIAEFDLNNPRYINPIEKGGYGLDGQWADEFHHALHSIITGEVNGYYEDFGTVSHLAKSMKDSYVYTGQYSKHRKKLFGVLPADNPYSQFVVFAQNHDQIGNRLAGDRLTSTLSFESLKLVAATVLLMPQTPLLFMGEEYGEKNPFQFFIDHSDQNLIEMVRKGRREEFHYFNWEGEIPDPQSEQTFLQCKLSWSFEQDKNEAKLLAYYKHLIAFRKTHPAMQGRDKKAITVYHDAANDKIIAFTRQHDAQQILAVLNFSQEAGGFSSPLAKGGKKIFDSSQEEWMGPGTQTPDDLQAARHITLNHASVVIYEY